MTRDLSRIRAAYQAGFQIGYSAGRSAVAHQLLTDTTRAAPASHAAADWLNELATLASREARAAGARPPKQAESCHTRPQQIADAATRTGSGLRRAAGHPHTDPAGLARSVGIADGRTAARWITATTLARAARDTLGQLAPLVNGVTAGRWLHHAQRRWFAAGSGGPSPLAGTPAASIHRHLAGRIGDPEAAMHTQQPPTAHPAARPRPGSTTTARHHRAGHQPGATSPPPPAPTPPPRPPHQCR